MTIELRDLLYVIALFGGPIAVYVGMRTDITRLSTQIGILLELVKELKAGRETHSGELSTIRQDHAALRAEHRALVDRVTRIENEHASAAE